jgi:hypothetical protein
VDFLYPILASSALGDAFGSEGGVGLFEFDDLFGNRRRELVLAGCGSRAQLPERRLPFHCIGTIHVTLHSFVWSVTPFPPSEWVINRSFAQMSPMRPASGPLST